MKKYIFYIMLIILASSVYSSYYKTIEEYQTNGYIRYIYNESFNTPTNYTLDVWNRWEYKNINGSLWNEGGSQYNVSSDTNSLRTFYEPTYPSLEYTATLDSLNFNTSNILINGSRLVIMVDNSHNQTTGGYFGFVFGFNSSNSSVPRTNYPIFAMNLQSLNDFTLYKQWNSSPIDQGGGVRIRQETSKPYTQGSKIRALFSFGYNSTINFIQGEADLFNVSNGGSLLSSPIINITYPNVSMINSNMSIMLQSGGIVSYDNIRIFIWYPLTGNYLNNCTAGKVAINVSFKEIISNNPAIVNATFQAIGDSNLTINQINVASFKVCIEPSEVNLNEEVTIQYGTATFSSYIYNTILNQNTQYLTFYTQATTGTFILTTKDRDTTQLLEGSQVTMQRFVNGAWVTVEQRTTDITGRAQFGYVENIQYKFNVIKAGYNDYEFYLNPVLFSSYNVLLTSNQAQNGTQDYSGVSIYWYPADFLNDTLNNFHFQIDNPSAGLLNYGYNLSWRGGSVKSEGTNPEGSILTSVFYIGQYQPNDVATLFYYYNTSLGIYNYQYYIPIGYNFNNNSMLTVNQQKTFGLNQFERVLIMTIIIIFVVGLCALAGHLMAGMFLGLFVQAFLSYIGFIPIWYILIPFVIAMFLMQAEGR